MDWTSGYPLDTSCFFPVASVNRHSYVGTSYLGWSQKVNPSSPSLMFWGGGRGGALLEIIVSESLILWQSRESFAGLTDWWWACQEVNPMWESPTLIWAHIDYINTDYINTQTHTYYAQQVTWKGHPLYRRTIFFHWGKGLRQTFVFRRGHNLLSLQGTHKVRQLMRHNINDSCGKKHKKQEPLCKLALVDMLFYVLLLDAYWTDLFCRSQLDQTWATKVQKRKGL